MDLGCARRPDAAGHRPSPPTGRNESSFLMRENSSAQRMTIFLPAVRAGRKNHVNPVNPVKKLGRLYRGSGDRRQEAED